MALYILQSIVVERIIGRLCNVAYGRSGIALPDELVNLVAYFVAPLFAFVSLVVHLFVTTRIRKLNVLRYAFGFKMRQQ